MVRVTSASLDGGRPRHEGVAVRVGEPLSITIHLVVKEDPGEIIVPEAEPEEGTKAATEAAEKHQQRASRSPMRSGEDAGTPSTAWASSPEQDSPRRREPDRRRGDKAPEDAHQDDRPEAHDMAPQEPQESQMPKTPATGEPV